jgi:hypothetical protein
MLMDSPLPLPPAAGAGLPLAGAVLPPLLGELRRLKRVRRLPLRRRPNRLARPLKKKPNWLPNSTKSSSPRAEPAASTSVAATVEIATTDALENSPTRKLRRVMETPLCYPSQPAN